VAAGRKVDEPFVTFGYAQAGQASADDLDLYQPRIRTRPFTTIFLAAPSRGLRARSRYCLRRRRSDGAKSRYRTGCSMFVNVRKYASFSLMI
jgi:hypothetical protein